MRWILIWPHYCIIIGWAAWLANTHAHTLPPTVLKENSAFKHITSIQFDSACTVLCRHINSQRHLPSFSAFLTHSTFGTASAQGQLKGVRPCQSTHRCWQSALNVCACVSLCETEAVLDEQWADLSPSQTLLIKAGNMCNLSSLA